MAKNTDAARVAKLFEESKLLLRERTDEIATLRHELEELKVRRDAVESPSRDLDQWLDAVTVIVPGMRDDDGPWPEDWYAVANDDGIIAYFGDESDACSFRLAYINRKMNG